MTIVFDGIASGMLLFGGGLLVAASVTTATGYPRVGIAMILMGMGMGLAMPPATERRCRCHRL